MAKTRACYNCLHYEQVPETEKNDVDVLARGFAPRCRKGLNPALESAPPHMPTRWDGKFEPDDMASFCDAYLWAPINWRIFRSMARNRLKKYPNFSTASLAEKFVRYYEASRAERIKVPCPWSYSRPYSFGHVSISSGWQPVFILVYTKSAKASSVTLTEDVEIIGVQRDGKGPYRPVL